MPTTPAATSPSTTKLQEIRGVCHDLNKIVTEMVGSLNLAMEDIATLSVAPSEGLYHTAYNILNRLKSDIIAPLDAKSQRWIAAVKASVSSSNHLASAEDLSENKHQSAPTLPKIEELSEELATLLNEIPRALRNARKQLEWIAILDPSKVSDEQITSINKVQEYIVCIGLGQKKLQKFLNLTGAEEEVFEIKKTLEDSMLTFKRLADAKKLTLVLDKSVEEHYMKCVFLNFTRVVDNLLANAVNYTPDGGKVTVLLKTARPSLTEQTISVTVVDTGIGINSQDRLKIFTPFYRSNAAIAHSEGTGIGLSSSLVLAKQLKGDITLESKEGEGSAFTFKSTTLLPTAGEVANFKEADRKATLTPPISPSPTFSKPLSKPSKPLAGRKILIADDSPINQSLLKRILQAAGAKVETVADGKETLEQDLSTFDVVMMDIQMPVLDGLSATRKIRASGSSVLIFGESADILEGAAEKAIAAGMNGYFTKPYDAAVMVAKIAQHLTEKELQIAVSKISSASTSPHTPGRRVSEPSASVVKSGLFSTSPQMKRSASSTYLARMQEVASSPCYNHRFSHSVLPPLGGSLFNSANVSPQTAADSRRLENARMKELEFGRGTILRSIAVR